MNDSYDTNEAGMCKQAITNMMIPKPNEDNPAQPFVSGNHICGFANYRQALAAFWDDKLVNRLIKRFGFIFAEYEIPDDKVVICDHQVFYNPDDAQIIDNLTLAVLKQRFLEEKYGSV